MATLSSFENGRSVDIGFRKVLDIVDYLGCEIDTKEKYHFLTFGELGLMKKKWLDKKSKMN